MSLAIIYLVMIFVTYILADIATTDPGYHHVRKHILWISVIWPVLIVFMISTYIEQNKKS